MATFLNNPSNTAADTNFGQIGFNDASGTKKGAEGVIAGATGQINASADSINNLLANYNPNNPASLLQAQQAMANYNLSITVTSSFIKSIEDTTKAVAQHIS